MKNLINCCSIIYLSEYNPDIEIAIYEALTSYISTFSSITAQLQNYSHDNELGEGSLTFSFSRPLLEVEKTELQSEFESELTQLQFFTHKKLF